MTVLAWTSTSMPLSCEVASAVSQFSFETLASAPDGTSSLPAPA